MDSVSLKAFEDEMSKIAGFGSLWRKITELFRPSEDRTTRKVDYFFSPKAGDDKWEKLPGNARSQRFVNAIAESPLADEKLKMHVQGMHDLAHGKPVAKIRSASSPGKTYEVRKTSDGALACQCNDWRFKGSVTPGYECKHIQAYRAGKSKAA
jgi:hypothetical protein